KGLTSIDIARAAGTSQATVSRALNGGIVSSRTRDRILAVCKELGYSPNAVARGLVTSRTRLVGVVAAEITNPFYPEFLELLGERLTANGQQMLLQHVTAGAEHDAVDLLLQQRADGIILLAATPGFTILQTLIEQGFPVVLANRTTDLACDAVEADNLAGPAAVADHLTGLGHRRIGVLEGTKATSTARQRTQGFTARLEQFGLALDPELIATTDFRYEAAYAATTRLLASPEPPSAIFCHNDLLAIAAINAATSLGVDVPHELSVAGFDNTQQSSWETV